jgi:hypothetical protein
MPEYNIYLRLARALLMPLSGAPFLAASETL